MPLQFTSQLCALLLSLLYYHPGSLVAQSAGGRLGVSEGQSDVGSVAPPGTLAYLSPQQAPTQSPRPASISSRADGLRFVLKSFSGDLSLTGDIDFPEKTGDHSAHRRN